MRNSFAIVFLLAAFGCSGTIFSELGTHFAAPIAVAVDVANNRAYVVNSNNSVEFDGASLSLLDISAPASPQLLASAANVVLIPNFSGQIYFDAATRLAYLANRFSEGSSDTSDNLLRINLDEASSSFGTVDSFAVGEDPFGAACCDGSGTGYLVQGGGSLLSFEPAIPASTAALSLAVSPSSRSGAGMGRQLAAGSLDQACVTNPAGRVYVINIAELGTSAQPIDYVLTNAGTVRGVASDGTNLYVVDGSTAAPALRVVPLSSIPAVAPDTVLSEVDITTLQSTTVALGTEPNEIVLFGGKGYVTNRGSDSVTAIDLASLAVEATITVGDEPFGMAAFLGADGVNYLYVTNLAGNSISIVDLGTNSVVTTLSP